MNMRFQLHQHIQTITIISTLLAGIFFSFGLTHAQETWICPATNDVFSSQLDCTTRCSLQGGGECYNPAISTPVSPGTSPDSSNPESSTPSSGGAPTPIEQPKLNLKNPLGSIASFAAFAEAIFRAIVIIAIPLTVIFLIWGGILFVTSLGNEERVKTAKKVFLWTVIGAMVIVASWVIAVALNNSIQTL